MYTVKIEYTIISLIHNQYILMLLIARSIEELGAGHFKKFLHINLDYETMCQHELLRSSFVVDIKKRMFWKLRSPSLPTNQWSGGRPDQPTEQTILEEAATAAAFPANSAAAASRIILCIIQLTFQKESFLFAAAY